MTRVVIKHLIDKPFERPVVDGREHTVRPFIEFIDRDITQKRLKRSVQEHAVSPGPNHRLSYPHKRLNRQYKTARSTRLHRPQNLCYSLNIFYVHKLVFLI